MKKVYFLIFLLLLLSTAFCVLPKTSLESFGLKGNIRTIALDEDTFYFNQAGNLETDNYIWYDEDYDEDTEGNINYAYDDKGRLISKEDEDYYEGFLGGSYYTYNSDGLLIEEKYEGLGEYSTKYTYNDKKQLNWMKDYSYDDTLDKATEYAYDKSGNKTKESDYDKDMQLIKYSEYSYDKSKNVTECRNYLAPNKLDSTHTYKYNAKNQRIEESVFIDNKLVKKTQNTYDAHGNITESTEVNALSNETTKFTTNYTYDSKGNWTEKKVLENGESSWDSERTFTYYEN